MIFWRTYNNTLYQAGEVDQLGFSIDDPSFIPNEYLEHQEFIILRTCFGLGDWGIISAFPRKLKEKYPDCRVFVPSPTLLNQMFGKFKSNWSSWEDPFQVVHTVFGSNPYVDGFVDSFEGDAFNDHFRIYDGDKDEPLLKQILRFWQIDNFENKEPEIYWTEEEVDFGETIIKEYTDGDYGTLLVSNRATESDLEKIQAKLDEYDLPMFYWFKKPQVNLKFTKTLDLRHIDIRIQLYIKSKAVFNVGNQTGVNDTIANYVPTFTVPRGKLGSNIVQSQFYL